MMKCLRSYALSLFRKKNAHSGGELSGARIFILPSIFFFSGYRFRHGVPNVTGILFGYELSIYVEIDCRKHEILILESCPPFNLGFPFENGGGKKDRQSKI